MADSDSGPGSGSDWGDMGTEMEEDSLVGLALPFPFGRVICSGIIEIENKSKYRYLR